MDHVQVSGLKMELLRGQLQTIPFEYLFIWVITYKL